MNNQEETREAEEIRVSMLSKGSVHIDVDLPPKVRNWRPSQLPKQSHIVLTTHPGRFGADPIPLNWFSKDPMVRGPIIATTKHFNVRNAIGTHGGSYSIYRGIAIASGILDPDYVPDLTNTEPVFEVKPNPSWGTDKIVSLDPWGHVVTSVFKSYFEEGYDIRPSIAVTKAHIFVPELTEFIQKGELKPDGVILLEGGNITVTKAAVDPVWYLPGVAQRFGTKPEELRRFLFEETGGMFPELVTRFDIQIFLPPIGGISLYIFGDPNFISDPSKKVTIRVHDECNGSDVFGSDICTCRPYLVHGIETCIRTAQEGGVGLIAYYRKEGRCLGEVTKFLVYNARKRQEGGDRGDTYFRRTECVAGVQDMRFQALMPDVLHWLGITKIDKLVSMSNMKYDAIVNSGIQVVERVPLPADRIPLDAQVEINAKIASGYFADGKKIDAEKLHETKGRGLD